jgi:hypothetical protein
LWAGVIKAKQSKAKKDQSCRVNNTFAGAAASGVLLERKRLPLLGNGTKIRRPEKTTTWNKIKLLSQPL